MTTTELNKLIDQAGLSLTSNTEIAKLVGFSRPHWWRLRSGKQTVNQRGADLIRLKLLPLTKRQ